MQDKPIISTLDPPFIELQSIDSTNNYALAQIRLGSPQHGTAFFAHEQTAGKGQRGRTWEAEKGANIALSIVLEPKPLLVSMQFQLSACIALAACKFFSRYAGADTKIKWPNDLYWQDRKAGGILIENSISGKQETANPQPGSIGAKDPGSNSPEWKWAVAGIGVNINQTLFPDNLPNPVSLKQITGTGYSTIQLAKELNSIVNKYFNRLIQEGFGGIYKEYHDSLYKLNQLIKLKKDNRVFLTTFMGISPAGQLITRNNKVEENFDFGEITWIIE